MNQNSKINAEYLQIFDKLITAQLDRAERLKHDECFTDFTSLEKIIVGIIPGDGIGPVIMTEAVKILNILLKDELEKIGRAHV